ncbi:uncharacterized protein [Littorina saxatilis]|uniref:EF-hand domain-containing protein n=1 Tax=Littorina saxatilis TaxID=31220 RepID=A0AAN9BSW1_9CAEN
MLRVCVLFGLLVAVKAQIHGGHVYEQAFHAADKDGNHFITMDEFTQVAQGFDINKDGQVSKQEFVTAFESATVGAQSPSANHQAAETLYAAVDTGSAGTVPLAQMSKLFQLFDADGDGQVSNLEFLEEWRKIHSH